MKKINITNRVGISENIFILGLIISSFVLINTIDIASRIIKEDKNNNNYSESIHYCLRYNDENKSSKDEYSDIIDEIIKCLKSLNCNASINGVGICVNNQIGDMFPEIIVNIKDDYKLLLSDSKNYSSNPQQYQLVVGESVIGLTENHTGQTLNVAGIQVPIQGVFKNNNSANIDYSITFVYDRCEVVLKQYLTKQICDAFSSFGITVNLYSDNDIYSEISNFTAEMEKLSIDCQQKVPQYEGNDYQNYWYRFYNKIFIAICLFFAMFTCFSLSFLWLSSRKKEIAIRKAFGYSNRNIFNLLVKNITVLTAPTILISMILEVIYCIIFDDFSFFDKYFIIKFFSVFLSIFVFGVICAVNLMREVTKITPVSAIREEK